MHRHDPELGEFALDNELCTLGPFDCFGTCVLIALLVVCAFISSFLTAMIVVVLLIM